MRSLSFVLLTVTLLAFAHAEQNCGDIILYGESVDPQYAYCTTAANVKAVNTYLTTLPLPYLSSITGSLTIQMNRDLTSVSLPMLKTVQKTLIFQANHKLSVIQLGSLDFVYDFEYDDNAKNDVEFPLTHAYMINIGREVASVTFPRLTGVSYAIKLQSSALTAVSLPNLANMGGTFTLSTAQYVGYLSLPALTTAQSLHIESNAHLDTINCPALATLTNGLYIEYNPALTTIKLPALTSLVGPINLQSQTSPHLYLYSCEPQLRASYHAICARAANLKVPSMKKLFDPRHLSGCASGMHKDATTGECVRDTVA